MRGTVNAIFLKPAHGEPMSPRNIAPVIAENGLRGDISYGRGNRQVLMIEQETLDEFGLEPGRVRENMVVKGLLLAGTPVGMRLKIGPVLAEVVGDCAPCDYIESIRPGLREAITGRRGTFVRILEDGEVKVGDEVVLFLRSP